MSFVCFVAKVVSSRESIMINHVRLWIVDAHNSMQIPKAIDHVVISYVQWCPNPPVLVGVVCCELIGKSENTQLPLV